MFQDSLELQPPRKLDHARRKRHGEIVVTRRADVPVLICDCKVGVVEQIESLCPKLQLHSLSQPDRLEQRSVDVKIARSIERVPRSVPDRTRNIIEQDLSGQDC